MATIFYDSFTGPASVPVQSRSPEMGADWVPTYGDSFLELDGAGNARPQASGGSFLGDAYVDVPIPPGTTELHISVQLTCPSTGTFEINAQRLTAPGVTAVGLAAATAYVGTTGGHKTFVPQVSCQQAATGTTTVDSLPSYGSSDSFVEAGRDWKLRTLAGGGTALLDGGAPVAACANEFLASAGGVFTDYGVRLNLVLFIGGTMRSADVTVYTNGSEDPPPMPAANNFWTDLVNTREAV